MACLLPAPMGLIWNALLVGKIASSLLYAGIFPTDISYQKIELLFFLIIWQPHQNFNSIYHFALTKKKKKLNISQ